MDDKLKNIISEAFFEFCSTDVQGKPYLRLHADANYGVLPDEELARILNNPSDDVLQDLQWAVCEYYEGDYDNLVSYLLDDVEQHLRKHTSVPKEVIDSIDFLDFWYDMGGYVVFPDITEQLIDVDIIVDTGDGNYDFVLNNPVWSWYGKEHSTFDDASSLLWLIKQQGYKKSKAMKQMKDKNCQDKFLLSVRNEIVNTTTHMNALVFCVSMYVREWLDMHEAILREAPGHNKYYPRKSKGRGYIILDKETTCGLYDPWGGAGGSMEITLNQPVKLPLRYIDSYGVDGSRGYSISEIYGVGSSLWDCSLVKIHPMKKDLRKAQHKGGTNDDCRAKEERSGKVAVTSKRR